MGEKTAKAWADERFDEDAPRHMSADQAYGWACGYNAAVAKSAQADLLAALVRIRDGSHEHSSAYSVALAAISKATGDA